MEHTITDGGSNIANIDRLIQLIDKPIYLILDQRTCDQNMFWMELSRTEPD